jgi:hypothetical protein
VNLIKVSRGDWLGHELMDAFTQCAIEQQVRTSAIGAAPTVERRPLPKDGRRIEVDMRPGTRRRRIVVAHLPFAFNRSLSSRRV